MRKRCAFAALTLLATLVSPAQAEEKWKGTWEKRTYTNDAGTRPYWLYVPEKVAQPDTPVVVYLHGCTQNGEDAAIGTKFNALAEKEGFIVVYPEQDPAANGARCWNWFLSQHQQRGSGEASIIAGIATTVRDEFRASPDHVFVTGASAGGAMSTIMGATYPDVFAAIGVVAGIPYSGDATGTLAYEAMGDHSRTMPAIIFQGTMDTLVVYPAGRTVLDGWLGTNDLADDGSPNGSVSRVPSIENRAFDQTPSPGSGNPCVENNNYPCVGGVVGFQGQYPHTIESYSVDGQDGFVQFWSIHGLGHAYPGGDPAGTFVDPLGPDITRASYDFFMSHPMPSEE